MDIQTCSVFLFANLSTYYYIDNIRLIRTFDGVSAWTLDVNPSDMTNRKPRNIYFAKTSDCDISESDANLVFEIDYLDVGTGPITLTYNRIPRETDTGVASERQTAQITTRTNTGLWKTAKVEITDAALRNAPNTSYTSFGIVIPEGTPANNIVIREIRVIKTADYE